MHQIYIFKFISNLPIDRIEFDRIEPSEKIDDFIWTSSKFYLPYGLYRINLLKNLKKSLLVRD